MKQVLALIQRERLDSVIAAVEQEEIGGLTVIPAQGRGKGDRPSISNPRGTGVHKARFNNLDTILIVVDDSQVDRITKLIVDAASRGSKGDGKIFITQVVDVIDIGTKKSGSNAL